MDQNNQMDHINQADQNNQMDRINQADQSPLTKRSIYADSKETSNQKGKGIRKTHSSMASHMISVIILSLLIVGIMVCVFAIFYYTSAIKKEYRITTYHMADTAAIMVNGDHIDAYLEGKETEEYQRTKRMLDIYTRSMHVSLIYVIKPDQSDYGSFLSVFNLINNEVGDTDYTPWELGFERKSTNDEYRRKYRALCEGKSQYETIYRIRHEVGLYPHVTTLIPIKDSQGSVTAILCIMRPFRELQKEFCLFIFHIILSALVMAVIAAFTAVLHMKKWVIAPIREVSREAARFAKENSKGKALGDISKFTEIYNLASSIDKMETDMMNHIEDLTVITTERERIKTELSFASTIQSKSLPSVFPAFPERKDFDIHASMTPAKEVGGDFYNFFLIDDEHLAIVIGDVSGKGVPASLFMMVTNIIISIRARLEGEMGSTVGTSSEILRFVNNCIYDHNEASMFVTIWLGIVELSTGKITVCNAGHEDAAVCRKNETFELIKTKHNVPIGIRRDVKYNDFEIKLKKGDKLFLYTDGVPEATKEDNEMYGLERMLDTLNEAKEKTPREILESIRVSVNEFVGDAPQFDDLTMLCFELK